MLYSKKIRSSNELEVYATMDLEEHTPMSAGDMEDEDLMGEMGEWEMEEYGWKDERGVGVVELILILVVLIALVTLFKTSLKDLVDKILTAISNGANQVMS